MEGGRDGGRERGRRERGGRGGREGRDDCYTYYSDGTTIGGRKITNLRFADDIDGITGEEDELTELVHN